MRIMLKTRPDGEYREIIREGRVTLEELAENSAVNCRILYCWLRSMENTKS